MTEAEQVARAFHEAYHRRAPDFGYEPRYDDPWDELPRKNRDLMIAVAEELLAAGKIVEGPRLEDGIHAALRRTDDEPRRLPW